MCGRPRDSFTVAKLPKDISHAEVFRRVRSGFESDIVVWSGHSMGGWVTVHMASHHPELLGATLISAADMGTPHTPILS